MKYAKRAGTEVQIIDVTGYNVATEADLADHAAQRAKVGAVIEINRLKAELAATDYKALKYAEGFLTDEEYAQVKAQRQAWRDRINELQAVVGEAL